MIRKTEKEIRSIIKEELISVLQEANMFHNSKGHFTSQDKATSYSLTAKSGVKDKDKIKKGIVSSGKISYRFGLPDKCGRRKIDGTDISPKQSCSKYPDEYYKNKEIEEGFIVGETDITDVSISDDKVLCIQISDIISMINKHDNRMQEQVSLQDDRRCRALGYSKFDDILRGIDSAVKASNGEFIQAKK